jgi:hypothetical protein
LTGRFRSRRLTTSDRTVRARLVRNTLFAWAWTFGVTLIWSFATPMFSSPDAPAHEIMAYAVGHGDFRPTQTNVYSSGVTSNANTVAPAGIVTAAQSIGCYVFKPDEPAGCAAPITNDATPTQFINPAGRNIPTYYFAVGWISNFTSTANAIWAIRVVSILIQSFFLAWTFAAAITMARPLVAMSGVLVAFTPMLAYFVGVANPNSLETTASMAVAASTLAFAKDPGSWLGRTMFRRAMIAATAMVTVRMLAPIWLAMWALAFLLIVDAMTRRAMLTKRSLAWMVAPTLGALINVVWTFTSGVRDMQAAPKTALSFWDTVVASKERIDNALPELVGVFGWLDTHLGWGTYLQYLIVALFMLAAAWGLLPPRPAKVVVAFFVSCYFVPILLQAFQWNENGPVWQTRYTYPILLLVPIAIFFLAAEHTSVGDARLAEIASKLTWMCPLGLSVLAFVHYQALQRQLGRNMVGASGQGPQTWVPPLSPRLLKILLVGLWAIVILVLMLMARRDRTEVAQAPASQATPATATA